jgi:uncharacterized membrane protein YjjP (DUF1212 family)
MVERGVTEQNGTQDPDVLTFIVRLGAAMSEMGEPSSIVQERLVKVALAFGIDAARVSAFPTYFRVSMGSGEPVVLELTTAFGVQLRLDQFAAIDRLVGDAEQGLVTAGVGLRRLEEISTSAPRFGRPMSVLGYCILTVGLCLILHPTASDVAAAAVFGVVVGLLRTLATTRPNLQVLMPVLAAFVVSVLAATAVEHDWIDPALRAVVASLVVFLPGATLTTAVLELAANQIVSGASRLVAGAVQLALLAFGILAGVEAVGVPSSTVLTVGGQRLGDWAPWLGVLVFAVGVAGAHSAPKWALPMLLVVLYTAWIGQLIGNIVLGGYVSAFVGAAAMTPMAYLVGRHPPAMPARASFLPGFWLLVPGALGLIGLTELAGDADAAGTNDLVATVSSIFAVAIGVLCGTLMIAGAESTRAWLTTSGVTAAPRALWRRRSSSD